MLPQQWATAAAYIHRLRARGEHARRQEEARIAHAIHQLHDASGFKWREGEQQ